MQKKREVMWQGKLITVATGSDMYMICEECKFCGDLNEKEVCPNCENSDMIVLEKCPSCGSPGKTEDEAGYLWGDEIFPCDLCREKIGYEQD